MTNYDTNKHLEFRTIHVPGRVTGYRGQLLESGGSLPVAEEMVELGCVLDAPTINYVFHFLAAHLPEMIMANGRGRRLGDLVTFRPVITGLFDTPDARFDPRRNGLRIIATVPGTLREGLRSLTVRNVTGAGETEI